MRYLKKTKHSLKIIRDYHKSLSRHIRNMAKSTMYWSEAQINANKRGLRNPKEVAHNLDILKERWQKIFDNISLKTATKIARGVDKRVTTALKSSLHEKGIPVIKFTLTEEVQDVIDIIIAENVNLIKSIPSRYFTQVNSIVLEGLSRGLDFHYIAEQLVKQTGITERRAKNIARDQICKADTAMSVVRQKHVGIKDGIWLHSGAPNEPRKSHVKANGQKFSLDKGLPVGDNGEYVLPGQPINCLCTWKPIIPY